VKTHLCGRSYPYENTGSDEPSSLERFGASRTAAELKAFALGVTALGGAVLGTRLTWPLLERAPLFLVFCAILASAHFLTETTGLLVILLAMFGAAQVVPPGGPAVIDDASIIMFLAASIFFNRLIVRRNQALAALRVSEEQFRNTWQHAAAGVALLDRRGHVERLNPAMERILGYPADAWRGVPFGYFVHPDEAVDLRTRFSALMAGEAQRSEFDRELRRRDGSSIVARVTLTPILDADGRPRGACLTCEDITGLRDAEQALRTTNENETMGLLVTGAVHNFRNLLTSVGGYSELLASRLEAQREDLDQIVKATRRAADLTQQIMAFGRLDAADDRVVDVNAIIGGVGDALSRLVGDQIELSCVLDPHLRPVHADPNHVEQVLMNLSVNARDAMPRGGRLVLETANVTVGSESYVRLVVRDTGSGMNDYVRSQLFKPFFTTKSQDAGTGLGLFTVDNIVKRMGGVIRVESTPNRGTTFMIDLPSLEPCLEPVA
jgi:two-component system, cell cycle sensor histidine kinase and response regulator CckA